MHHIFYIRSPNNDEIEVKVSSLNITLHDFKISLRHHGITIHPDQMILLKRDSGDIYDNDLDNKSLQFLNWNGGEDIDIIKKISTNTYNYQDIFYSYYIAKTDPVVYDRDVPVSIQINIDFIKNSTGNNIYVPSLAMSHHDMDLKYHQKDDNNNNNNNNDNNDNNNGSKDDKKWINDDYYQKIFLLKLKGIYVDNNDESHRKSGSGLLELEQLVTHGRYIKKCGRKVLELLSHVNNTTISTTSTTTNTNTTTGDIVSNDGNYIKNSSHPNTDTDTDVDTNTSAGNSSSSSSSSSSSGGVSINTTHHHHRHHQRHHIHGIDKHSSPPNTNSSSGSINIQDIDIVIENNVPSSWKNYTDSLPVQCDIQFKQHELQPTSIALIPREHLEYDTWYVIVLQHGCILTPLHHTQSHLPYHSIDCVVDDYLIPFCTVGKNEEENHRKKI